MAVEAAAITPSLLYAFVFNGLVTSARQAGPQGRARRAREDPSRRGGGRDLSEPGRPSRLLHSRLRPPLRLMASSPGTEIAYDGLPCVALTSFTMPTRLRLRRRRIPSMPFMPFNILGIWFRGLLSIAILAGGIYLLDAGTTSPTSSCP